MMRIILTGILTLAMLAAGIAADSGILLVESYGKLWLIRTDGAQQPLTDSIITAALSQDGQKLAFTQSGNPAVPNSAQALSVMPVGGTTPNQVSKVSLSAQVRSIGWLPDGNAIVYEGKGGHLFMARLLLDRSAPPRDLGPWYQGFSISSDGMKILHAVNFPVMGLEVLDVGSAERTLIHKTAKVVWDAKFSPNGEWIAYEMTLHDPPRTKDDEPDCTPPTIGLRVYSMRTKRDTAVSIAAAPKDWNNVRSFSWSPDSKRLALTLGTTDCDYPGTANGVFITSLDLKSQVRASVTNMSLEPIFSPDGGAIAFVDFSEPPARLIRYDLATGGRTLIRRATQADNDYHLLDWR